MYLVVYAPASEPDLVKLSLVSAPMSYEYSLKGTIQRFGDSLKHDLHGSPVGLCGSRAILHDPGG
eukprot:847853-Amorphochlora_amoeboformis.AAC.1